MAEKPKPKPPAKPAPVTGCEAVRAEASKYTGWDVSIITAIAEAESTTHMNGVSKPCDVNATGDKTLTYQANGRTYGYSLSVLQVRILEGREHCDKHDLSTNVKCAHDIWKGQGYEAWTMYTNGRYLQYL